MPTPRIDQVFVHATDGDTNPSRKRSLFECLQEHSQSYASLDRAAFFGDDQSGDQDIPLRFSRVEGQWFVLTFVGEPTYERQLRVADLMGALVCTEDFDWALCGGDQPSGPPTMATIGSVVAVGEPLLDRIGRHRFTTAPGFAVADRGDGVVLIATLSGDKPVIDTGRHENKPVIEPVKTHLNDPDAETEVETCTSCELEVVPGVGNDPIALLDAIGGWLREDVNAAVTRAPDAVDRLTALLEDDRPAVRREAAWAIKLQPSRELNPTEQVDRLLDLATDDPAPEVRQAAMDAASNIENSADDDPQRREHLMSVARQLALGDPDPDPDPDVRTAAVLALTKRYRKVQNQDELLATLREVYDSDPDGTVRGAALGTLFRRDQDTDRLFDALGSQDPDLRDLAALQLRMRVDSIESSLVSTGSGMREQLKKHTGAICRAVNAEDDAVRAAAIRALGTIDAEVQTVQLVKALRNDSAATTRTAAARALGQVGDESKMEALVDALSDDSVYVREAAADAIGTIYEEDPSFDSPVDPVPELLDLLNSEDPELSMARGYAIEALGSIGDERAVEPILAAAVDGRGHKRDPLKELGKLGDAGVDALVDQLRRAADEGDSRQVKRVAAALAVADDERAFEPLQNVYETDDLRSNTYAKVGAALGSNGGQKAVEPLLVGLREGREGAVEGLGEVGPGAVDPLLELLSDDISEEIERRVVLALARTGQSRATERVLRLLPTAGPDLSEQICRNLARSNDERLVPVLRQLSILAPTEVVRSAAEDGYQELCRRVRN